MKNIHILPTDKPSRLFYANKGQELCIATILSTYSTGQNMYITNNEEPLIGDYYFNPKTNTVQRRTDGTNNESYKDLRKVILTTNKLLIKDDVQAIDDEFLEWFVKNPSYEEVEVEKTFVTNSGLGYQEYAVLDSNFKVIEINVKIPQVSYYIGKVTILNTYEYVINYKIIIPKEEPNIVDKLKEYLEKTPKEQIQKDWDESCKQVEGVKGPTVSEFIKAQKQYSKQETLEPLEVPIPVENKGVSTWNKSNTTPEFDGEYLCYISCREECGNVHRYYKVVSCSFNTWIINKNERVALWKELPKNPFNE